MDKGLAFFTDLLVAWMLVVVGANNAIIKQLNV